jgi:hypothetical protein
LAGVLAVLTVTGCNYNESSERRVEVTPIESVRVQTCTVPCDGSNAALARIILWDSTIRWNETIEWNEAVAKAVEAAKQQVRVVEGVKQRPSTAVSAPSPQGLESIIQCIKDHESGNYNESSHTRDGSGAYQVIPDTWQSWSSRAGHGGYAYAYQAPPEVQDAVVVFMLRNGGAGNWSPRFGNNPCTVGMGG